MHHSDFVTYGDGYRRTIDAHVGKNDRRVFVDGKYIGTERDLGIPGGYYRSPAAAYAKKAKPPGATGYRQTVLERDRRCVVTGTPASARIYSKGESVALVQAAHIKPRKLCEEGEYWDSENGLAMRADIHAAFDAGLFTIGSDGRIIPCRWIEEEFFPPYIITQLSEKQKQYLKGHREWTQDNWSRWAF